MHTAGWVTQDQPNTDGEIFISAIDAIATSGAGVVTAALGTSGLVGIKIPASITGVVQLTPSGLLLRTGVLQSQALGAARSQEAFGTAAATPGPSAVSGTSGPSAFGVNSVIAPVLKANLPTLIGSVAGARAKGIQINWLDFIYQVGTLAATSINAQLFKLATALGADVTPASTALTTSTTLSAVVNSTTAKVHRQRVTPATPAFLIDDADVLSIVFTGVTPATSTVTLAGVVLGVSFNYN